jgi:hypothetical protein
MAQGGTRQTVRLVEAPVDDPLDAAPQRLKPYGLSGS